MADGTNSTRTTPTSMIRKASLFKTIGFILICTMGLGITIVSSIMASTNFSFGEDPNYKNSFKLDLTEVEEGEKPSAEKDLIDPTTDARGIIDFLIEEKLPDNIISGKTIIKEFEIDGKPITGAVLLDQNKVYLVTFTAHIFYDINNIIVRAVLNAAALILIIYGVIMYKISARKDKDPEYARHKLSIDDSHFSFRPVLWKQYEDPINLTRKINAWRDQCIDKEVLLDNKATEEDLRIFVKGTDEEKEQNKYCRSKALIRYFYSDEWINENIQFKKIKFDKITYRLIFIGDVPSKEANRSNEYITKNKLGIIVVENLPRIILGAGVSILLSLLVVDIINFNMAVLANAFIAIANIAWNIYLSINYANAFFDSKVLWDIAFRDGVAKEYISYIKGKDVKKEESLITKPKLLEVQKDE